MADQTNDKEGQDSKSTASERKVRNIPLWMAGGGIVAVVVVVTSNPALVRFSSESVFDLSATLAPFILVALLLERAVEVVVKGARIKTKAQMRNDKRSDEVFRSFSTETRGITFLASFIGGTLLAMAGVRIISAFLADDAEYAMGGIQRDIFLSIDVIITGLVLAGGADGLHKLVTLGTTFLDNQKKAMTNEVGSE
jgi:hypothetical protein